MILLALAGALIQSPVYAQKRSLCETYLRADIPSGPKDAERVGNESSVQLFERRVIEYRVENDALREYEVIHKRFKVFDEKALTDLAELYIPLARVDEVVFIKARATSPLGEVTETDISKIKSVEEDGDQYKLLAVEGVQINGTVELIYGLRKSPNIYRSYYLGGGTRILESEYWVIAPENLTMDHYVFNTDKYAKKDSTMGTEDEDKGKATIFSFKEIPAMVTLGKNFPNTPLKYRVESSLRRNKSRSNGINYEYNDIARLSYDVISKEKEKGAKDIKKIASKINLDGKTTEREKIIEVESYVKMNFKKAESDAPEANTIKYLVSTKSGSDNALISLYSGLFDQLGIKYEIGFTYDRTVKFIEPEFENWANLDQWVIRFPNADTYILPVDIISPPGYLNNDYRGTNMIRIKTLQVGDIVSAVSDLVKIPSGPLSRQKEVMKISLDADFMPASKYEYNISGQRGASLKWIRDLTFEEPSLFMSVVKNVVESRYEDEKERAKNITFRFTDNYGEGDFTATVLFASVPEELVEKAGDNYIFYPGRYFQSNFMLQDIPKDYAYPMQAKENTFLEFEMEVPIPEGYKAEVPKESIVTQKLDFGNGKTVSLEVEYKVEADKVKVIIREDQQLGKLDAKDVTKLNDIIAALRKIEKIYFILTKV